jgi:MoaA/NifB/PqqE/SkfB family radical SAM enzyme
MKRCTLFFKITYLCNDACPFCWVYRQRKEEVSDLSLDDLIKNLKYFSKRFNIHRVIITGGEPTLHPEFFKILEYLKCHVPAVNLLTNAINFAEEEFLSEIKNLLFCNTRGDNVISFSLNNHPNNKSNILKKRVKGVVNLAKSGLSSVGVITISKGNARSLHKIVRFILNLKKYNFNLKCIELRMLFLGKEYMLEGLQKYTLPCSFDEVKPSLEIAISYLKESGIRYILRNLPLCYLDKPREHKNPGIENLMQTDVFMVDDRHQFDGALKQKGQKYLLSHSSCKKCSLHGRCGGIAPDFISVYNYPKLIAVK